jgi:hypothetical protein
MSRYKGWREIWTSKGILVFRNPKHRETITKSYIGTYYYYYDSPGGQRSRYSLERLRDAIADVEASHENRS